MNIFKAMYQNNKYLPGEYIELPQVSGIKQRKTVEKCMIQTQSKCCHLFSHCDHPHHKSGTVTVQ